MRGGPWSSDTRREEDGLAGTGYSPVSCFFNNNADCSSDIKIDWYSLSGALKSCVSASTKIRLGRELLPSVLRRRGWRSDGKLVATDLQWSLNGIVCACVRVSVCCMNRIIIIMRTSRCNQQHGSAECGLLEINYIGTGSGAPAPSDERRAAVSPHGRTAAFSRPGEPPARTKIIVTASTRAAAYIFNMFIIYIHIYGVSTAGDDRDHGSAPTSALPRSPTPGVSEGRRGAFRRFSWPRPVPRSEVGTRDSPTAAAAAAVVSSSGERRVSSRIAATTGWLFLLAWVLGRRVYGVYSP